jgi:hypothetical protein
MGLAHCVSLTANAIRSPRHSADESEAHATVLAREVGLDMVAYWQPTAASYFGRVSKERIVQAVREGVSEQSTPEHCPHEETGHGRSRRGGAERQALATFDLGCQSRLRLTKLKTAKRARPGVTPLRASLRIDQVGDAAVCAVAARGKP